MDLARAPIVAIWEVTQACDLACLHCRASARPWRHPSELTTREGLRLIEEAAALGTRLFVFSGGDPLKRRDLATLIRHAADCQLHPSVTPSATPLLTYGAVAEMADAGVEAVAISLDGSDAPSHDAFRGWSGAFDRSIAAASYVRQAGLRLQINTTVSTTNKDELSKIARRVTELGAQRWSVFFLVPTGRGAKLQPLSAEEHEQVYEWLADLRLHVPFAVKTTEGPAYRRVLQQRGAGPRVSVGDGKGFCFISHTGDVMPSGFLPIVAGNVRDTPLALIYRGSDLFRSLRDPTRLKGKCGRCFFRNACGGSRARAYAMTGNYLAEEPTCVYVPT